MSAIAAVTSRIGLIGDRVHDVLRALQPGPAVRIARPPQQRPRRLEHRDHGRSECGPELRPRGAPGARRPLRAGRRVPRGGHQAVGQLGGRGAGRRRRERALRRHRPDPLDRPRRTALLRRRTAQHRPLAAGPAGLRAGRVVGGRAGVRRALGRGDLHRAPDPGERPGVLPRCEEPGSRERAQPRPGEGAPGDQPVHRVDHPRGGGAARGVQQRSPSRRTPSNSSGG